MKLSETERCSKIQKNNVGHIEVHLQRFCSNLERATMWFYQLISKISYETKQCAPVV